MQRRMRGASRVSVAPRLCDAVECKGCRCNINTEVPVKCCIFAETVGVEENVVYLKT